MGEREFRLSSLSDAAWADLQAYAHPADAPLPEWYRVYYGTLAAIIEERQPRHVVELGVRAGYSSHTMLRASPSSIVYGIDGDLDERTENTHGGVQGQFRHALLHLPRERFIFERRNTRDIQRLPPCDLVYVDADHTYEGATRDLKLAAACTSAILCDDYDSSPGVRQALDEFATVNPQWRTGYYGDEGRTIPGFVLLLKGDA